LYLAEPARSLLDRQIHHCIDLSKSFGCDEYRWVNSPVVRTRDDDNGRTGIKGILFGGFYVLGDPHP